MTHDELVAKINERTDYAVEIMQEKTGVYEPDDYAWFALRAVVELHKPYSSFYFIHCTMCQQIYPCETIQAIEKELG